MDKNNKFFPDDVDSDNSESIIGGLGSMIVKEESTIFSNQKTTTEFMDSEGNRSGGSVTFEKEELKRSESDYMEEDSEMQKGDDFTDSDEEDLSIRFCK